MKVTAKFKPLLLCIITLFILSGCAMSTMQTATTTPPGQTDLFFGGSATSGGFTPEIGFRTGLTDNLDIGLRLFALGFMAEAKLAIFQNRVKGPSLAMAGGFGYSYIPGNDNDDVKFYVIDFGPIFSINMSAIEPYIALKFRKFGFDTTTSNDFINDFSGEFVLINFGVCLFPNASISLFIEGTYFKSIEIFDTKVSANSQGLYSAGIRFRI